MRLADTAAAELAQVAWLGLDEPGAVRQQSIRHAIRRGLPGDVDLEDVIVWARPAMRSVADAGDTATLEGTLLAALAAALIMGAKLQETNGT